MRRPLSLALRLTLLFGITAAIVFPIFGWVLVETTENHFLEQDSDELKVIAHAVQEVLSSVRPTDEHQLLRFEDILVGHHHASLQLTAPNGRVVYASPNPDLSAITSSLQAKTKAPLIRRWNGPERSYHVLTQSLSTGIQEDKEQYSLAVAVPIDSHLRFLVEFRRNLALMSAVSIVLMGLIGWLAIRQGHAPLRDIVARIRRISTDELDTRLSPETVPSELSDLAVSFNEMLQRLDQTFHKLSDFNADIAHELRTPVANLMTQSQVGLSRERTAEEYREILYSNMEEYERIAQMIGDMLYLAQTDAVQLKQNHSEFDLAEETQALFDFYEGWAEERGVSLTIEGNAIVHGDRPMLRRALSNLISNAIRHTKSGETVQIELKKSHQGEVRISVENPGDPIPPDQIPRLFDRFYRVDRSRLRGDQGAGLGLAIVKSIVNAHGGRIDVVSTGESTRFIITLSPKTRPAD